MKIKKEIINKIKDKQKEKNRIFELYKNASTIITKYEMHRLKKILKNEEKEQKLRDWANCLAMQQDNKIAKQYKEYLNEVIDIMNLTIVYTLHFNEKCKFGNMRIEDFMKDYFVTYELFANKELAPEDLIEQLKKEKIDVEPILKMRR